MSKISQIIDKLSQIIEAEISGITEIPNPYEPEANSDLYLQNGYGVGFGNASNSNRNMGATVTIEREFFIMLFRLVAATPQDTAAIKTSAKNLLEDELKLIKAIELNRDLDKLAMNAQYTGSDSLDFLAGETGNRYFQQIITVSVEYRENLT